MKNLRLVEEIYWRKYCANIPELECCSDTWVEANYCGDPTITDQLLALYLSGKKHAGSSLIRDDETAGDPLPKVGNYWIILDSMDFPNF